MTRSTPGDEESERQLSYWITDMPEALREMRAEVLDEDFPFDFSVRSLDALEGHMLAEYGAGEKVTMDFRPALCAMIYLGEVLMTVAGGVWGWNRREAPGSPEGQPVVCPDPALGLQPIAPFLLIAYATRTRTGDAFAREVARLDRAVAERKEQEPGWEPETVLHPDEAERKSGTDHPKLAQWLDQRAQAFPAWAEEAGKAEQWDFGPESLDRLEDLVRGRFADDGEIAAAKSSPFVQGAVWYLGEVIRRAKDGAVWQYRPGSLYDGSAVEAMFSAKEPSVLNTPMVGQPGLREGGVVYPMGALNVLFWERDELDNPMDAHLSDILDDFAR